MAEVEWVKLELDVASFDSVPFDPRLQNLRALGFRFPSLTDVGNTEPNRFRLYELNAECSKDIPGRGSFHSWDEYQQVRLNAPSFDPAGVTVAVEGEEWIGMSAVSHREGFDYAFAEMTGTVRSRRGRGIATSMKLYGIAFARERGLATIRTVHHPDNEAMIALNRRLGFVDAEWSYPNT